MTKKSSQKKVEGKSKNLISGGTESSETDVIVDSIHVLDAYEVFKSCIKRSNNLLSLNSRDPNINRNQLCDSYRASMVLSISALDAYIRTFVVQSIQNLLADSKKGLPQPLADYIKSLLNQDKLLDAARNSDLMEKVNRAFREDFEKKSFQGDWKITNYMKLVGHQDIFKKIAVKANINEQTLRKNIEVYTKRRHVIAHCGDFDLNENPPIENKITKKNAQDCIKLVADIAKHINEIDKNE